MNGISCTILGLATPSRIACLSPLRKELNLMRRDHVLTARLSVEELALLPALRHAIVEEVSKPMCWFGHSKTSAVVSRQATNSAPPLTRMVSPSVPQLYSNSSALGPSVLGTKKPAAAAHA